MGENGHTGACLPVSHMWSPLGSPPISLASEAHGWGKSLASMVRKQMVQEQPRPPGMSQGPAFVGRLRGGIKHDPCESFWPAAWMLHSGLVGPAKRQGIALFSALTAEQPPDP